MRLNFTQVRAEQYAILFIICISILIQINAAIHHGYMGQDYDSHVKRTINILNINSVYGLYDVVLTNPPLFYLVGAFFYKIVGMNYFLEYSTYAFIAMNGVALYLYFKLSQTIIASSLLRISAIIFLAFLPLRMVHSVVYAPDIVTALPFTGVILLYTLLDRCKTDRGKVFVVISIGLTLCLSIFSKYTFFSFLPASLIMFFFYFKKKIINRNIFILALIVAVLIPCLWASGQHFLSRRNENLNRHQWIANGDLTWRNILFPKIEDLGILEAPSYNSSVLVNNYPVFDLLRPGRYSFMALTHLAIFTDIQNVFQYDPRDHNYGIRTPFSQKKMGLSVKTSLFFTTFCLLSVLFFSIKSFYYLIYDNEKFSVNMFTLLLFSWAAFLIVVVFLPYVQYAYQWGYWMPRLTMAPLMAFFLISFVGFDNMSVKLKSTFNLVIFIFVLAQSALHVSFLWTLER